jgi:SagB-type dehydrogenase family enzyme
MLALVLVSLLTLGCTSGVPEPSRTPVTPPQYPIIKLPEPRLRGEMSLEEALLERRSVRDYAPGPLRLAEVSQLLWAAQGVTAEWGGRTAPSAGALYPLETYLVAGNVENLSPGVYKYNPTGHELIKVSDRDVREELAVAAVNQTCVKEGAISIVIAAVYERTTAKYGDRGVMYVHMEAGHAAQNIYLQATALGLGVVAVGAFYDDQVKDIIGLSENEAPLYIIPVGRAVR